MADAGTYNAVSPDFMRKMRTYWQQREATTGVTPNPMDIQALAEAELNVNANERARDRAYAESQRQFNVNTDLRQQEIDAQEQANTISGITQVGTLGVVGHKTGAFKDAYNAGEKAYKAGKEWLYPETAADVATSVAPSVGAMSPTGYAIVPNLGLEGSKLGAEAFPGLVPGATPQMSAVGGEAAAAGGMTTAGAVGLAGAAYGAQLATSPWVDKYLGDKADMPYTAKAWKYGGAVGALAVAPVEFVVKGVEKLTDSYLCTELHRQGRISHVQYAWCAIYMHAHAPEPHIVAGYATWAPVVARWMKKEGWFNRVTMPFTTRLVRQFVNIAKDNTGTWSERAVHAVGYAISWTVYHLCSTGEFMAARTT